MTEPRDILRDPQAKAAADPGLDVEPELVQDLDVTDDDADAIAGGCSWTKVNTTQPR